MKTIKPLLLLLALSFVLCTSMKCKKDKTEPVPVLPAETQTGARTFGCLIDGEIYLPTGKSLVPAISTSIQFDGLNLNTNRGNEYINFSIPNMTEVGDYLLIANTNNARYILGNKTYSCTKGILTITRYDKTNKIISGRFSFVGKDNTSSKTINVTDGCFDVTFTN